MTNPVKGEALLTLGDGREFTLVADHASLVKASQAYSGKTKLNKLMADMQPMMGEDGQVALDEDGDPVKDTVPATAAFLFGLLSTNILLGDVDAVQDALAMVVLLGFPDAAPEKGEVGNVPNGVSKPPGANGASAD
jgi:hypothetical protein